MKEMRKFPRIALPHRIELLYRDRCYQGHLENLSVNGALVRLDDRVELPTGQGCMLCIDLASEGEAPPLRLGAETIHGSSALIGLRFTGCDDQTSSSLELLVQLLAAQPDRLNYDLERIRGYLSDYRKTSPRRPGAMKTG